MLSAAITETGILAVLAAGLFSAPAIGSEPEGMGLHVHEWAAHKDAPTSPSLLIGAPSGPSLSKEAKASALSGAQAVVTVPCSTVFGYLPYWVDSSTLTQYDHLTHIACFSLELNPNGDGTFSDLHGWPWTTLINTAHAHGVKVILVVTLFNDSGIKTLIQNSAGTFFSNLKDQMLAGNADGANIDFETNNVDPSWQSSMDEFMGSLTTYLHAELPGSEVSYAGPAVNWGPRYDLGALATACDYIFIMGYNYYTGGSQTSGPCSPLTGGSHNITDTVNNQYGTVTQNNPEKLILGIPYYGTHWTTADSGAYSRKINYIEHIFYRDEKSATYGRLWDSTSQTPWYRWFDGTYWNQVWYDDAQSLGLKYDFAISKNLRGVGLWALGYDGSRSELWTALETHIGMGCVPPIINPVPDGQVKSNTTYTYQPTLAQGTPPVTWSKTQGPAALIVDPATGAVGGWRPTDGDVGTTVTIGIRAANGVGSDTQTWQVQVVAYIPGDFNGDRRVDAADLVLFRNCTTGAANPYTDPSCADRDFDHDGDVDQSDFGVFQVCISGMEPGDPKCAG